MIEEQKKGRVGRKLFNFGAKFKKQKIDDDLCFKRRNHLC